MDFLTQFDTEFAPKLGHRAASFRAVFAELLSRVQVIYIVETGCLREVGNFAGDGQSTLLFAGLVAQTGGLVFSVDASERAVEIARSVCQNQTLISCADSVGFLRRFSRPIDLLYLDSLDFDGNQPLIAATHTLFELCAAARRLHRGSIVMVDDTWLIDGKPFGKGMLIAEYMEKINAPVLIKGEYQIAWTMP